MTTTSLSGPEPFPKSRLRVSRTICLPIEEEEYNRIIDFPSEFRNWLDKNYSLHPELFPNDFGSGYTLKDSRQSAKLGIVVRRIECDLTDQAYSIRPSFIAPYMAGKTDEISKGLLLRNCGVPFWVISEVLGRDPMYWYRLTVSLGFNSVVGTTVRTAEIPQHLVADEHHQQRDGEMNYIAVTAGEECCLGAELSQGIDAENLGPAYAVFKKEAQNVDPNYKPKSVNLDGWGATVKVWKLLFPVMLIIRCFLHGWIGIRKTGKHMGKAFQDLSGRVWNAFRAANPRQLGQRMRRMREWAEKNLSSKVVLDQVKKMVDRKKEYSEAYKESGSKRTSNMVDRMMRSMNKYFDNGQHLHGGKEACNKHCRAWALLYNFCQWSPETTRANGGYRCRAERLNKKRYCENWLQNLYVHASLRGIRSQISVAPQNP